MSAIRALVAEAEDERARRRRCDIARVEGAGTSRMLYLWYFEKNEARLARFLNCVRVSFQ